MFKTKELPQEINTQRWTQRHAQARKLSTRLDSISEPQQMKKFNLFMPKFHALGDYVHTIQMFGTTDLFLTQVV
jgi:hypothetical protein